MTNAAAAASSGPPLKHTPIPVAALAFGAVLLAIGIVIIAGADYFTSNVPFVSSIIPWLGCIVALTGNVIVLRKLPFSMASIIVWIELLIGFALFCRLFNLQLDYVFSKAGVLIGWEVRDGFVQGALLTLFICAVSIALAMVIALVAALAKLFGGGGLHGLTTFYISFFRGTPLLLQVLIIYLGLPQIGWTISAIPAGIMALCLNYGAYMAEIFRSGIQAIGRGQWEASDALGLSRYRCLRHVILPQSMRLIVPATGNQFIMMLKDSALVSVMGVWELMYVARAIGRADFRYMEMLIAAAVIYWALSAILEVLQARLEVYYARDTKR
ncbi:amino acid ABC transporter permease [Labrys neptuniae]